ncbi:MAG: GDP-L-fucose synthase [Pyrinomonadaceae bacterium]
MAKDKRVYIAGSNGMVGSAIRRDLENRGYRSLILRSSDELDLIDQKAVNNFFTSEKPEIVILAAAKVGGILANNTFRADFLYKNLMIEANVINAAFIAGVEKLIFLGSSCIYPRLAVQPIKEEELLTGAIEPTNEPYAIAKIAGIKLCESYYRQHGANFLSMMPTNIYGPGDNYDLGSSHVIPALIHKFHAAKIGGLSHVVVWGTGNAQREFLYVDDLADAIAFVMENIDANMLYDEGISNLNIGCGKDISISELAEKVRQIVGFKGTIRFDTSKPDGTPRKLLDVSRINRSGWKHTTCLEDGLKMTYETFLRSEFVSI